MRRELTGWAGLPMMGWLTVALWLDRSGGGGGLWLQRGLGLVTWVVLLAALSRVHPVVRAQTATVVVVATVVEFVFSPTLEVYTYRFDNVPAFVPPGHGLVYLSAVALGHASYVERHRRAACVTVLLLGGVWAAYGVLLAGRSDVLGAFWYACLVLFMLVGPSRAVCVGAFVAVSYLEVVGTNLGTWTWAVSDPTGWVSIGNPPSGAAGGYGWFDLAGLLAAQPLLRFWWRSVLVGRTLRRLGGRPSTRVEVVQRPGAARGHVGIVVVGDRGDEGQSLVVQSAVAGQRVAAERAGGAVEGGEAATRLPDDHVEGGHVVELQLGLSGQVHRPLGNQHVGPEVAVRPGAPAAPGQRHEPVQPVALLPPGQRRVGQRRVVEPGHVGDPAFGGP